MRTPPPLGRRVQGTLLGFDGTGEFRLDRFKFAQELFEALIVDDAESGAGGQFEIAGVEQSLKTLREVRVIVDGFHGTEGWQDGGLGIRQYADTPQPKPFRHLPQRLQEPFPVAIIADAVPPFISAGHHLRDRPRTLDPEPAWQGHAIRPTTGGVSSVKG